MLIAARNAICRPQGAKERYWGLSLEAEEANSTVSMAANRTPPAVKLDYSLDNGKTWEAFTIGSTSLTLRNKGDAVCFRAGNGGTGGDGKNGRMASSTAAYNYFVLTGKIAAYGDVTSLLDRDGPVSEFAAANKYMFLKLFTDCAALTRAPELPATTLADHCYRHMFQNCSALAAAPELPATTLASNCYYGMFSGCESLAAAPRLPAATIAANCYREMFQSCTSLAAAPSLPAATLQANCYNRMFFGCAALAAAPELPATALVTSCYYGMFFGCKSLKEIKVHFETWGAYTSDWVLGIDGTGTFYCPAALGNDSTIERGGNRCPANFTVVNV